MEIGKKKKLFILGLIIYCGIVIYITILSRESKSERQVDFSLFYTYYSVWHYEWNYAARYILLEVLGNVIMFLPFGILVGAISYPYFYKKSILLGLGFSVLIECTQYLTATGVFQLADLVHNTIGAVTGMVLYFTAILWKNKKFRDYRRKKIYKGYIPIIILLSILITVSIRPVLREFI